MSEFMGLIRGTYEAKQEGFLPGGVLVIHLLSIMDWCLLFSWTATSLHVILLETGMLANTNLR